MTINYTDLDTTGFRTLAVLRADLIADLGYAAVAANPPPGMAAYLNLKLRQAHDLLWRRFPALRTERWFSWPLTANIRFYNLISNFEVGNAPISPKLLDPYAINWVGVQRGTTRTQLRHGVPAQAIGYTTTGWPTHYEINQGIELWPAPATTEGTLLVKGRFKVTAFAVDADQPGIDDSMVYLLALANAKAHYRHPDANNYVQQMETLLANLVAGTHATARYVPGQGRDADMVYVRPMPSVPFP